MTAEGGTGGRQPLLLGTIAAVIGIGLAILLFGGGTGPGTSASPSPVAEASASTAPSATLVAVATDAPSAGISAPPVTQAPTLVPTSAPTTAPTAAPTPTATPNTNPVIVLWETPKQEDCTNSTAGSVHVKWSVKRASGVSISIDGPGIYQSYAGLTGEVDLPYGCDNNVLQHTYTLRTIGGTGPADSDTNTIRTRAPSIVSFEMGDAPCVQGGDRFVGISMSFEIRAATGAALDRAGLPYSTYNTKTADDIVQFDCFEESMLWRLTTTGGFGDEATKAIRVFNPLFL